MKNVGASTMGNYFKMGFFLVLGGLSALLTYKILVVLIFKVMYG